MLGNVLTRKIFSDTKSIQLMDEFESYNDQHVRKYDTLMFKSIFMVAYDNKRYRISLFLQRKPDNLKCIYSLLTFTELKKLYVNRSFTIEQRDEFEVLDEVFKGIKRVNLSEQSYYDYFFQRPVLFNAQNSSNRFYFGSTWCGGECVEEGTLYGETTEYVFIGARFENWP